MARPKQSVKGNLILLGVFLLPAAVALVVAHATGSAAAGWFTLAITTGLVLAAIVAFVASINVSRARPNLTRTQLIWLGLLTFTLASVLAMIPLIIARW